MENGSNIVTKIDITSGNVFDGAHFKELEEQNQKRYYKKYQITMNPKSTNKKTKYWAKNF